MRCFLSILIFQISFFSLAQEVKPKCLEGNCKNKIGTYLYSDSSIYIGSFSDKLRNGQGKITYKSGATYEGEWVSDKREGQGVFIDSLKTKYEGAWLDDKENGIGKFTDTKGNVYEGTWTNGELTGLIILRYKNGSLFEGQFNKGFNGQGKLTYKDGSIYSGNFVNNKRSGYGELIYHFGLTYKGNWVSNEVEGQGQFYLTSSQLQIAQGIWKTDKTIASDLKFINAEGYMVCYYSNKNLYFGKSQEGLPNSSGKMSYSNGDVYEGNFVKGVYHGKGKLTLKDKTEYNGNWKSGIKDGYGTLTDANKTVLNGYWENGIYIGKEKPIYSILEVNSNIYTPNKKCKILVTTNEKLNFSNDLELGEVAIEGEILNSSENINNYPVLFGLMNFDGSVILKPEYESIEIIENSCTWLALKNDEILFINKNGKVTNYQYQYDENFNVDYADFGFKHGLKKVKNLNGKIGFIDETGFEIIKAIYKDADLISEDLIAVYNGEKWGIINRNSEFIVNYKYDKINPFCDNLSLVVTDEKYGYLNKKGELVIPQKFNYDERGDGKCYGYNFEHGLARNYDKVIGCYRFIDKSGNFVGDTYHSIDCFELSSHFKLFSVEKKLQPLTSWDKLVGYSYRNGIVNTAGKIIVPVEYNRFEIMEDFIISVKNDMFGLIDSTGKILKDALYSKQIIQDEIKNKSFENSEQDVSSFIKIVENRKYGLSDISGKIVLPMNYDRIISLGDNVFHCFKGEKQFVIYFE